MFAPSGILLAITLFSTATFALVNPGTDGIIGLTSLQAENLPVYNESRMASGCKWYGRAPLCRGRCPSGWSQERSASSRFAPFSLFPSVEESFGDACLPTKKKVYCCKVNKLDRSWSGKWVSSQTGGYLDCKYISHKLKMDPEELGYYCGWLKCHNKQRLEKVFEITGQDCTGLRLNNSIEDVEGLAKNGHISWSTTENPKRTDDCWIKTDPSIPFPK